MVPNEQLPPAIPASTIVLIRDGDAPLSGSVDVEVLVVRRHGKSGFMAGATVFPGGKVDPCDAELATADAIASTPRASSPALPFWIAAARELHEEASVLLASDAAGQRVGADDCAAVLPHLDALRDGHRIDAAAHHGLLNDRGWRFALDELVPFAHWVTPKVEPRRFDTWFFVAIAPPEQAGRIDGFETTALGWMSAADAIAKHESGGDIWLPPPTYHTLHRIAEIGGTAANVVATLRDAGRVPRWMPHFIADTADGPLIVLPDDPLHPEYTGPDAATAQHRFALRDGRFAYQRSR